MTATIRTKSIFDPKERDDGVRALVTRYYPRGVRRERFDLWRREASPKVELLKQYRSGSIDWKESEKRFREQLRTSESAAAIEEIVDLANKKAGNITLLSYEREGENCHRYLVKERLESLMRYKKKGKSD